MSTRQRQGVFGKHAKSSAAFISLIIHAIFIVIAISFVAINVYVKDDLTFEAKSIRRPQLKLRKLEVPVKVERFKKVKKPKLRKNIVANPKFKTTDISLPEMTGIRGGMGYLDGEGLGDLGFGGLEINFFGIMGGGENIVFIIDYSTSMTGGKEQIMRREAERVITELPNDISYAVIFFAGPAWPADTDLRHGIKGLVRSPSKHLSIRPRKWSNLPTVRYKIASENSRKRTIKHIKETPLTAGTVYDIPLYMALSMDPLPDTVFFMTDGSCREERGIESLRTMLTQLKDAGKKVPRIHTVGFGISANEKYQEAAVRQLQEMAKLTDGECSFLTTEDYIDLYGPDTSNPKKIQPNNNAIRSIESVPIDEYPIDLDLGLSK